MEIQNTLNFRQIFTQVFRLFEVKWKYDPNLSIQKMYAYYANEFVYGGTQKYVTSMQKAHDVLLTKYIWTGYKF